MPPHERDNDIERLAQIDILEELRITAEDLRELARQAIARATTQRRVTRSLVQDVRQARAQRGAENLTPLNIDPWQDPVRPGRIGEPGIRIAARGTISLA